MLKISNWPQSFPYLATSTSRELRIEDLRILMFPPNVINSDESPLIRDQCVHHALEVRVLQKPHPLGAKRTNLGHRHRGLFATESIPKNTFLGEYTGVMCIDPSEEGHSEYKWEVKHEHFTLHVDASTGGNELAFVNDYHKIGPSPNVEPCFISYQGVHYFGFQTIESLKPDEELLIDYGNQFWKSLS